MEGRSLVLSHCCSSGSQFLFNIFENTSLFSPHPRPRTSPSSNFSSNWRNPNHSVKARAQFLSESATNRKFSLTAALKETVTNCTFRGVVKDDNSYGLPKIDKSGRFCSPRAARELALLILYASCLEGSDPVRLFDNRMNTPRDLGYEFDRSTLLKYDHMNFGGSPVTAATMEEAEQLLSEFETESAVEAAVLSAPPQLVYNKLLLRFTRKLLDAVVNRWNSHVLVIDRITPLDWKIEPSGRILEFSILHLAMSEISVLGTKYQIVINEAVDLAKRFCDGAAPRKINGCLRTFVQDFYPDDLSS